MRWQPFAVAALVVGPLMACGGKTFTDPGGGKRSVTSISISPGTDMLRINATENYVATARYSDGTSETVAPSWRSDSPNVVTIDTDGRAMGRGAGNATIIAEHEGLSGSKPLRVVPDYGGSWRGYVRYLACTGDGNWAESCREIGAGAGDAISLAVTQQDASISATLDVGGFAGPVTGSIALDGTLSVTGTYSISLDGFPVDLSVTEWQTLSTDNARMTGHAVFTMRSSMAGGQARLDAELMAVTKQMNALSAAPAQGAGVLARTARRARHQSRP